MSVSGLYKLSSLNLFSVKLEPKILISTKLMILFWTFDDKTVSFLDWNLSFKVIMCIDFEL